MDLENSELSCVNFQSRSIRSVEYECRALVIKANNLSGSQILVFNLDQPGLQQLDNMHL